MNTEEAIKFLEKQIKDPKKGLPQEIFYFASRIVPMINVDLLIKNKKGQTLLAWRDDNFYNQGWHIPGGIIRFKETAEQRIQKVAIQEIGAKVKFEPQPIGIYQFFAKHETRGHFISLLYKCSVPDSFEPKNKNIKEKQAGYIKWHDSCPKDFLKVQSVYKKYINNKK